MSKGGMKLLLCIRSLRWMIPVAVLHCADSQPLLQLTLGHSLKLVMFQLSLMQNAATFAYSYSSNSSSHIVDLQVLWANFCQSLEISSWKKSPTSINSFVLLHEYKLSVALQRSMNSSDFHMWIWIYNTSSFAELWRKMRQILLYHL